MSTQKLLHLPSRLEPSHPSLPHPGRFMRLRCPIVRISRVVMNNIRDQLPMSNAITAQLVSNDFPGLSTM